MCFSSLRLATLYSCWPPSLVYVMRLSSYLIVAVVVPCGSDKSISFVITFSVVTLFKPLRSLFNLNVNVFAPSASTAMLSLADSNLVPSDVWISLAPAVSVPSLVPSPCTFTKEPNFCLFSVDVLLPVNFKPSSIVATSRLISLLSASFNGLPLASFGTYTIR